MVNYFVDKDGLKTLFFILCGLGLILGLNIGALMNRPHSANSESKNHTIVVNTPSDKELEKQEEITERASSGGEEFSLKGCLTDGNKEYEIEMFLSIMDNEASGKYRYLSKPKNAVIGLSGSVELEPTGGTGVYAFSKHIRLMSDDKKEIFTFEIHPAYQEVEGEWFLFDSPADASTGKVAKKLDVHLSWE